MTEKSFRVLLDVTELRLESYKYIWINISPRELKTISDLKIYVLHKINFECDVQFFVREGLLLDEETIGILREDDTVKIKYKTSVCPDLPKKSTVQSEKFSRKRNVSEHDINDEEINSKRYKPEIVTLSSNGHENNFTEKKSKKERRKQTSKPINSENACYTSVQKRKNEKESSKYSENICCTSVEKREKQLESSVSFETCHSIVELNGSQNFKKKKKKTSVAFDQAVADTDFIRTDDPFLKVGCSQQEQSKNKKSSKSALLEPENVVVLSTNSSKNESNLHENESSEVAVMDINIEESKNTRKRKRKRHRKRKQSEICDISVSYDVVNDIKLFSKNIDESINRKHKLYLSPDESQDNCLNDGSKFYSSTDTFVLKEDKFVEIQSLDYPQMSTPAQSSNCTVPNWQLSIMSSKNSNLSYNRNGSILQDKSATKSIAYQSNIENKSEKQLYEDLSDITSLPVVGTCIAYKALELDESYSPTVTDYREGIVEKINPDTEELEIRLNKEIILPGRIGKFENLEKDEVPEPTIKLYDILKWSDIISPKLLKFA